MLAVIDYRAGNLTSVRLACQSIGVEAEITSNPDTILLAERVIFPGVGAAGAAMRTLESLGLVRVIKRVAAKGTPFLGICLGSQIILEQSEEDEGTRCIGLIPGMVRRFRPRDRWTKIPHMGWNSVRRTQEHPLLQGVEDASEFYFVHAYYPDVPDPACVLGRTEYAGVAFPSIIARGNVVAAQFHPEKSGRVGLRLLENFAHWNPSPRDGNAGPSARQP